jgi:hypothetical protein
MHLILKTLAFLWVAGALQAATLSFDTVVLKDFKRSKQDAWVNTVNKNLVVTAGVLENVYFDLNSKNVTGYVQKLEETRSSVNFFAGISDWVVTKHALQKVKEHNALLLQGEFKHAKKTTYFREKQVFVSPNIYQLKISSEDAKDLSDENSEKIFNSLLAVIP